MRMNYTVIGLRYVDDAREEHDEEVVVVDADAVDRESAVVVVLHAALVAHRAVVHARQLVHLALVAVLELPEVVVERVEQVLGQEVVIVEDLLGFRVEHGQVRVRVLLALRQDLFQLSELYRHAHALTN